MRQPDSGSDSDDAPPPQRSARRAAYASQEEEEAVSPSPSGSEDDGTGSDGEHALRAPHGLPAFLGGGRTAATLTAASLPLGLRAAAALQDGWRPARRARLHAAEVEHVSTSGEDEEDDDGDGDPSTTTHRRANKNRPAVASAHARPPRTREVPGLPSGLLRPPGRDPRFDDLTSEKRVRPGKSARRSAAAAAGGGAAGAAAAAGFDARARARYAFLYEDTLPSERAALAKSLRKAKAPEARAALAGRLTQVSQAMASDTAAQAAAAALAARRARERAAVAAGKKPFYQKPAVARREALVAKFEVLKASGKLESAMAKRRKKNAAKAHRHMPYRRE
jgi:hypothetical protein